MRVTQLGLSDFRNYESLDVRFEPGINVLLGPNGQGKTNAVEAIAYLATMRSHRVAGDAALVRVGCENAIIRSTVTQDDRSVGLDVQINPGRSNRVQVNRTPVRRVRDAYGIVRAVMFAPEDLSLVKGDPAARRRLLDDLLVQLTPRYAAVIGDYEKTLKQRNSLLRTASKATAAERDSLYSTLDVWDERLIGFGADLVAGRLAVLDRINDRVQQAYAAVAVHRNDVTLQYQPARFSAPVTGIQDIEAQMREALAQVRSEEFARGLTVLGPHRDELTIELNDLPARGYASHGESWSLALALRLAGYEALADEHVGRPVLILDDVFAELDSGRRERLAEVAVATEGQVFITAAVSSDVPAAVDGVTFLVDDGVLTRSDT